MKSFSVWRKVSYFVLIEFSHLKNKCLLINIFRGLGEQTPNVTCNLLDSVLCCSTCYKVWQRFSEGLFWATQTCAEPAVKGQRSIWVFILCTCVWRCRETVITVLMTVKFVCRNSSFQTCHQPQWHKPSWLFTVWTETIDVCSLLLLG